MPMTVEQLRHLTEEERGIHDVYAVAGKRYVDGFTGDDVGFLLTTIAALRQRVAEKVLQEVADDDAKNALAARPTGNAEREGDWRYRVGAVKDLLQGQVRAGVNMEELSRQIVTALAARPIGGEG